MKKFMQPLIGAVMLLAAVIIAPAQTPTSPLYTGLQQTFDLGNSNSLVNANEVNLTPFVKWNSRDSKLGGGFSADWWVTDQQGAFLAFEEYSNRKSYFSFGYGARTVFSGIEIATHLGTRQDNDDPFGEVELFARPSASVRVFRNDNFDLRITIGADITPRDRPNPYVGLTVRALKF
jgi:hypothetical protein